MRIYSIFDAATKAFNTPFFQLTDAEAVRTFREIINQKGNMISTTPTDFGLYLLGEYNKDNGDILGVQPLKVCSAIELVNKYVDLENVEEIKEQAE